MRPEAFLLVGLFIALIALRVPISFGLGISSLITLLVIGKDPAVTTQLIFAGMDKDSLLAIPFFVLAGAIMSQGGMARKLVDLATLVVGWLPGGLAVVNIVSSMFFGAISGSAVAATSAVGSTMIPSMVEKGNDRAYATSVTITASTQGLLIPPSHNAIIFSLAAGGAASIEALFIAGIVPGIMVGLALIAVAVTIAVKRGYPRETDVTKGQGLKGVIRIVRDAILPIISPLIIVGGIMFGWFTAIESSVIAVVWALLVNFIVFAWLYKDTSMKEYPGVAFEAIKVIVMVMWLIGNATAFGYCLTVLRVPEAVTGGLLAITENKYALLLLINIMLLLLGTIMDMAPLIIIITPILLPVTRHIGVDPTHFGIIMIANLGLGLCTPPVGSALFVGCAIGKTRIEKVSRAIWPFYLSMVAVILLITYVPFFSMALVNAYLGN